MAVENLPETVKAFKEGYDHMDFGAIAAHFSDQVRFQGTAEKDYRDATPEDITAYFSKIGETRSAQEVEISRVDVLENGALSIDAVFHSSAKDGSKNPDKPVRFDVSLNGEGKIVSFRSQPRADSV